MVIQTMKAGRPSEVAAETRRVALPWVEPGPLDDLLRGRRAWDHTPPRQKGTEQKGKDASMPGVPKQGTAGIFKKLRVRFGLDRPLFAFYRGFVYRNPKALWNSCSAKIGNM